MPRGGHLMRGITRANIARLCQQEGLPLRECDFYLTQVRTETWTDTLIEACSIHVHMYYLRALMSKFMKFRAIFGMAQCLTRCTLMADIDRSGVVTRHRSVPGRDTRQQGCSVLTRCSQHAGPQGSCARVFGLRLAPSWPAVL
jgi:hypothetical protein